MLQKITLLNIMVFFIVVETNAQIINTNSGPIQGQMNGTVYEFLGIPFASPPVGDLRWKAPQALPEWQTILNTTEFSPVCPQKRYEPGETTATFEGDEDCLYLNVWSPTLANENLPVMVFIHGGGNQQGSASQMAGGFPMYHGKNMAERGDVVVVTIQYRLGPLGFLVHPGLDAESENQISGNYGILDQILALKWIQQNISKFGGNPNNVMIFGESAGGVDVGDLMVTSMAEGLFHKAAIQSAAPVLSSYADALKTGNDFVNQYAPSGTDSEKIEVLRSISADSIIKSLESPIQGGLVKSIWKPALDGLVFTDFPMVKVQSGNYNKVPLIVGSNTDEMSVNAPAVVTPAMMILLVNTLIPEQYRSRVLELYPPGETNEQAWESYVGLLTDSQFSLPVRRTAQCISLNQDEPVWKYFLTFKHWFPQMQKYGSYHGVELLYLFNNWENTTGGSGILFRPQDDSLQQVLLNYWVNFAYTGNPNGNGLENWPQYSASEDCYLEINATPDGSNCGTSTEKLDLLEEMTGIPGCIITNSSVIDDSAIDIRIYPNPATNKVYYFVEGNVDPKIRLFNSIGQQVKLNVKSQVINIEKLDPGIYFIQYETENGVINRKLIKR